MARNSNRTGLMTPNSNTATGMLDAGAFTLYVASFAQLLPSIAAFLSVAWFGLRILETRTVQKLLGKWSWIEYKAGDKDDE